MKLRYALFAGILLYSHSAWAQEDVSEKQAEERSETETAAPTSGVGALCRKLVQNAQDIGRLLSNVTDKESADQVASEVDKRLALMNEKLRELEAYPFHHEQDAEELKTHMATLTHVSQGCLSIMQKLVEVNAYGSEALMSVFMRYKVDDNKLQRLQAEDLPHTPLYEELADSLTDALYCLLKVQDADSAQQILPDLRKHLKKIEHTHHMLTQLAPPRTDEQREAVRPARERLQQLTKELKEVNDRLQEAHCYRNKELDLILPRLLQAAAS